MEQKPSAAARGCRQTKHLTPAILCCVFFMLICLWSVLSIHAITSGQTLQYEAERWQGPSEQAYAQVSVCWDEGKMNAGQAEMLSEEFASSFPTEEIPPFVTAYGAKASGLAAYGHRSAEAKLWNVSKDFFKLHAFSMAEGGPGTFAETGSEAVLNEAAAFALFGSNDCVGEDIQLGGLGWRVIAVIKEPDGAVNKAAFSSAPRIFLPIADDAAVSFYEAILPEYYNGFAAQTLGNAAGGQASVSTGRFRVDRLWKTSEAFFTTPPEERPSLPPWEQAALLAERRLCLLWAIAALSAVCLLVSLIAVLIKLIRTAGRFGGPVFCSQKSFCISCKTVDRMIK